MLRCSLSDHIEQNSICLITICVYTRCTGIVKSENCCYQTFDPLQTEARGMVRWGNFTINRTDPAPPLSHSLLHRLMQPLSQDIKSQVHPQHPQEPSCKAMKMSRLCLSAAILFLPVILVDSTPVYEQNTQDQGRITFPL